ncbi:MAG: hypothetical protein G3M78_08920 [Candidatus Nitrohelix vancouverensis]|uniref:Methyltransferase domain-containing protein n=1 Tax=Candidatus Nitrohelix vancouverensis TaxID=2705534 RepID=A0A7T0G3N1_9BACT|nr:MAG: hypothetical protein G3M78_08920 [Candidatus Nitrohelix vancouverensis]
MSSVTEESAGSALRLLGCSFLVLFFELALIRFVPAQVQIASYFLNLVLIAAFLGIGLGLILESRCREIRYLFFPFWLLLILVCAYFSNTFVQTPWRLGEEWFWTDRMEISETSRQWGMVPVVSILFFASTFVFVPLGFAVGRELSKFPPLRGYGINIGGSLLGLVAFAAMSYLGAPPLAWFGVTGLAFLALCWNRRTLIAFLTCFPVVLYVANDLRLPGTELWSSYYKINVFPHDNSVTLNVNGSLHQYILNLDENDPSTGKFIAAVREDYLKPYAFARSLDDVLILGAGTGNDVVIALQKGAKRIDAVEIDRSILQLGRELHFQRPYDDPRVTTHVDDARAYLKKTDRLYDLIVLGTLDSQTLLSGMSSLRLDNYVYTLESFQAIRDRLKPDGILILHHMSVLKFISHKIFLTLDEAFGTPPWMHFENDHRLFNFTFVAGKGISSEEKSGYFFNRILDDPGLRRSLIPTDDWPYLYLASPMIPSHYWQAGALIAVVSLILVLIAMGRRGQGQGFDAPLFFLGAGFLLLETKSVTEMSLLFGSTWAVNVLVFSVVLVLVWLANRTVMRIAPMNTQTLFFALYALILAGYWIPANSLLSLPITAQWFLGGALTAAPIFFSGIIFSQLFRRRAQPASALGFNLLGAIAGGLLEYGSMAMGTKSMYLVLFVIYLIANLCDRKDAGTVVAQS